MNRKFRQVLFSACLAFMPLSYIQGMLQPSDDSGVKGEKKELSKQVIKLDGLELKKIEVQLPPLENCPEKTYLPCNPCICKIDEGYLVICRTVNYDIDFKRQPLIQPIDLGHSLRTKNILVRYDKDFNKISEAPIVNETDDVKYFHERYGLEDYRIFNWDKEFWFLSSTYDTGTQGIPKKVLGRLKNIETKDKVELDNVITIDYPCTKWGEKNWMPFIRDNKLHAIYSFDPFTVFQIEKDGIYKVIVKNEQNFNLSEFRGSAILEGFCEGYLAIVHESEVTPDKANYFHRFVYLDYNLNIKKISDRFTFTNEDIEFVCGMSLDHSNKKIVIGLGVWDREAYVCLMNIDYVNSLLKRINH